MDDDCDIYADLDLLPVHDFGSGVETNLKRKCSTSEPVASKSQRVEDDRVHCRNDQNSNRELNCQTDREHGSRDDQKRKSKERVLDRSSSDRLDRKASYPSDRHRGSTEAKSSESSSQSNAHLPNAHSSNVLTSKAKPTDRILNQNKPRQSPRKPPRESPRKSPLQSSRKSPYSRPSPSSKQSPRKSGNSGDHLAELIILEEKLLRLEEKCSALEREKEQKAKANLELNRTVTVLKTNISSLYKTAKTEIDRKGQQIKELQSELDSLKFRKFKRADQGANWYAQPSQAPANQLNQFYW